MFITMFTTSRHWTQFWKTLINLAPFHSVPLINILILSPCLPWFLAFISQRSHPYVDDIYFKKFFASPTNFKYEGPPLFGCQSRYSYVLMLPCVAVQCNLFNTCLKCALLFYCDWLKLCVYVTASVPRPG
jgi:hypothetical protein